MRRILIVLTRSIDPLNDVLVTAQQQVPESQVEILDLTGDHPDYDRLLAATFESDSVQVW